MQFVLLYLLKLIFLPIIPVFCFIILIKHILKTFLSNMAEQRVLDSVTKNDVLKLQCALEDKARKEWHRKWGFYLDFNKICLEVAKEKGISEKEFRRLTEFRKPKGNMEAPIWQPVPTPYVPNTSTGFVGWRANYEYSLEKFGKLYISPRHTLPYEPPYKCIFLG